MHTIPSSAQSLPDETISSLLNPSDTFVRRHVGPDGDEIKAMLREISADSLDELIDQTVPESIRLNRPLNLGEPRGETEVLAELRAIASLNKVYRSFIGQGYYNTITPPVILRNILENPGWYTQYTPYQAEIAQGRLEALLNFQTMVSDLSGLPLAGASLLDEGTAAGESMAMCRSILDNARNTFVVAADCHPQTIAVMQTRAKGLGINLVVASHEELAKALVASAKSTNSEPGALANDNPSVSNAVSINASDVAGILLQYPTTDGKIVDYRATIEAAHKAGALVVMAADLLALTLITAPGELGADIAIGSTQRFGVPVGFGGPHAAYMATKPEYVRKMPGRLVGMSRDVHGNPALRLAIQTREQHIRREKATSNICTAQVLLAIIASMYAVYHGPHGLRRIAHRVHAYTRALAAGLQRLGHDVGTDPFFDTLKVRLNGLPASSIHAAADAGKINLRAYDDETVGISLDETTTRNDVEAILACFAGGSTFRINVDELASESNGQSTHGIGSRQSDFLTHPVFNKHHSEHELLRYIFMLQGRDLSLTHSMIPLGSCTMKLNATSEMLPVTWPEFGALHPFAPADQTKGYQKLFSDLETWLSEITGFAACSLQPNAGSQGEYAGLMTIRAYNESRGQDHRDICLIPVSAHGTNPSSAVVAGLKVVAVACDSNGSIEVSDLKAKAAQYADKLAALMITYPSTHGVFESSAKEICSIIHAHGGQVYMDGANMNAQVGLCRPGDIGADVCHLNLHKTFCIPHGGGGPGMGPICVAEHLQPFLPICNLQSAIFNLQSGENKSLQNADCKLQIANSGKQALRISAANYGSASILPISWVYIALMGAAGLKRATEVAILNANYMAKRLEGAYDVLFKGEAGRVAHEFVIDCRPFEASANIKPEDIAKRLMDYGFHAPTMSWPVTGTLMIEPTESEDKGELDRFCEAMLTIRQEIADIESGKLDRVDNPLKNAPHTADHVTGDTWPHKYGRQQAAYPAPWLKSHKFWPYVGRVDNPWGDRNLVCACPPVSEQLD